MKALVFEKSGLENLKVQSVSEPGLGAHDVLIKVKMAGVNPIDYFVVNFIPVEPFPVFNELLLFSLTLNHFPQ